MQDDQENFYAAPEADIGPDYQSNPTSEMIADDPRTFSDTLSEIVSLVAKAFGPLLGVAVLWGMFQMMTGYFLEHGAEEASLTAMFWASLAALIIATPAFMIYAYKRLDNVYHDRRLDGEIDFIVSRYVPICLFSLLVLPIVGIGSLFCLFPGLILGVILVPGFVSVIVEENGPIEGIKRAFELFNGIDDWFYAFGISFVMAMVIGIPTAGAALAVELSTGSDPIMRNFAEGAFSIVTFPISLITYYMIFRGLVARHHFNNQPPPPQPNRQPAGTQPAGGGQSDGYTADNPPQNNNQQW